MEGEGDEFAPGYLPNFKPIVSSLSDSSLNSTVELDEVFSLEGSWDEYVDWDTWDRFLHRDDGNENKELTIEEQQEKATVTDRNKHSSNLSHQPSSCYHKPHTFSSVQKKKNCVSTMNEVSLLRKKTRFSALQIASLHKFFIAQPYPSANDWEKIAESAGVTLEQVKRWFNNRRFKERHSR